MRLLTAVLAAALVLLPAAPASAAGQAPVAVDDAVGIRSYAGVAHLVDALANDTDPDGDTLVYTAVSTAAKGRPSIENGRLFYAAYIGNTGTDSFTYTVSDGQGNTDTGTVTATLWGDLPAPSGLAISSGDTSSATLTWPAATDAVQYQVFRNTVLVHTTSSPTWTDTGLLADRQYGYRIASVNGGGYGGAQSGAVYRQPQQPTPTALTVTVPDDPTALTLTWSNGGYGPWNVYRDGALVASSPTRAFTDTGLVTGREYSYHVQTAAFSSPGSITPTSALSAPVRATPVVLTDIGRYVRDHGGSLGPVTVTERGITGGRQQDHQNGLVLQQDGEAPFSVTGTLATAYIGLGGAAGELGFPVAAQESGLRDGGVSQIFEAGSIWDSLSTSPVVIPWFIEDGWAASGWEEGPLGYPVEDFVELDDGFAQSFQDGVVYWSEATGAHGVSGPSQERYASAGGPSGDLGYPTTEEYCGQRDGGCWQGFQGGYVHSSPTTGAQITSGAALDTWAAQGWEDGPLGYPTTGLHCGLRGGGCWQGFQGGYIHSSPTTGAQATYGAVLNTWAAQGWQNGPLGYPTTGLHCGLRNGGCWQGFQGGYIHWSPTTGAQATYGAMLNTWAAQGWQNGPLGYPTTGLHCGLRNGGCWQGFQGGYIHWSSATGAQATTGAILNAWAAQGWQNGRLGYPTAAATVSGSVARQTFQGGSITVDLRTGRVTYR